MEIIKSPVPCEAGCLGPVRGAELEEMPFQRGVSAPDDLAGALETKVSLWFSWVFWFFSVLCLQMGIILKVYG